MTTINRDFDHLGDYSFDVLPCNILNEDVKVWVRRKVLAGLPSAFDGVHIGHKELLRTLVYMCTLRGYEPAVLQWIAILNFSEVRTANHCLMV